MHTLFRVKNMAHCIRESPVRGRKYNGRELHKSVSKKEIYIYVK